MWYKCNAMQLMTELETEIKDKVPLFIHYFAHMRCQVYNDPSLKRTTNQVSDINKIFFWCLTDRPTIRLHFDSKVLKQCLFFPKS